MHIKVREEMTRVDAGPSCDAFDPSVTGVLSPDSVVVLDMGSEKKTSDC